MGRWEDEKVGRWEDEKVGREFEFGLRPLRAVGSLYEPEAIGA